MDTKKTVRDIFKESLRIKEQFVSDEASIDAVAEAASALVECYRRGGKVIVFGNGGSAADSQHLAAELVVRFEKERKSLPCVALTTNTSILTATSNDYDFSRIFSRQIEALADPSDVVVAISTSGNSENVLEGARAARAKKVPVIALTGRDGGKLVKESDIAIVARAENTARIQEIHVTVIHILCKIVEDALTR
jgi:D-sedoheptulose 7-phosphate isomerase